MGSVVLHRELCHFFIVKIVLTHGFNRGIYHELTTSELMAGLSRKVYVTAKNQYLDDENE